jgi:hypothetical protein
MKLIQMQYSPDAFDSFIKQKLNEVEVDPSKADDYWSKMNNDLTQKKGFSGGKKFIYFSLCLVVLSSIFYFVPNEPSDAPVAEKALKQTPAITRNEDSSNQQLSDAPLYNKPHNEVEIKQKITNKVKSNQTDETKTATRITDNTGIDNNTTAQENLPAKDNKVADQNKPTTHALPVTAKDSVRAVESNPVIPKKKKTPVTIIW